MSWRIDGSGREYHNYEEYQRASRRSGEARRQAEENRIKLELDRLNNKRIKLKSKFKSAAGDSRRLMTISRQLHQNYEDFERFHDRVKVRQREFEERLDSQFSEDWKHMQRQLDAAAQRVSEKTRKMEKATGEVRAKLENEVRETQKALDELSQQKIVLDEEINRHKKATSEKFTAFEKEINVQIKEFVTLLADINQTVVSYYH